MTQPQPLEPDEAIQVYLTERQTELSPETHDNHRYYLLTSGPTRAVSDRCGVSNRVLEEHYDRRDEQEKVQQRREVFGSQIFSTEWKQDRHIARYFDLNQSYFPSLSNGPIQGFVLCLIFLPCRTVKHRVSRLNGVVAYSGQFDGTEYR